ncbi:hypothetical protein Tco_0161722 [Tanacetum coccineum]
MMKCSDIGIQEKKAKLFNDRKRFTSTDGESIESYYHHFLNLMNDFKRNKHFPEKIASNLKFLNNLQPECSRHVTIVHQTKDLHITDYTQLYDFLKYNQKEVNCSTGYKHGLRQTDADGWRQWNQVVQNAVQNLGVQNVGNQNGLIIVPGIANQNLNRNSNVAAAQAESNTTGNNHNQIRCYNCKGLEAGIQLQAKEFDLMAVAMDLDKIKEVNANYRSVEVHNYDNCYDNEIFNMFTQEVQYTKQLKPIPEPHQVQQNDSNVISEVSSMEQDGGTVDQHLATIKETRAYFESLYNNLVIKVEKLSMEKSTISSLEEKKKLKSGFKIREDELLDKQIQIENKNN